MNQTATVLPAGVFTIAGHAARLPAQVIAQLLLMEK
jgi:hypothetical protein